MIVNFIVLIIAFIILLKAADVFVDSSCSIATNFKLPKMVIALTVAAFGTCTPELAISFNSVFSHNGDVALANVLGSNIVNILLIIGIASSIYPIRIKNETMKRQLPILVAITSTLSMFLIVNIITKASSILHWFETVFLILYFIMFITYIFSLKKTFKDKLTQEKPKYTLVKSIVYTLLCMVIIILSSNVLVDKAVLIAQEFNISQKIITMTVIVIGTSLPELVTTVIASKKKEFDLAIGNIIGTNIFNIGVVLGLPITIYGGISSTAFNIVDALVLELAVVILFISASTNRKLSRREGILMIGVFLVYYLYMFLN